MQGRWWFRIAKADATGEYVSSDGKPLEHTGTDAEALAIAVRLQDEHPQALHVEVVSVGAPLEITDVPGRLQLRVQERADRQGGTSEAIQSGPGTNIGSSSPRFGAKNPAAANDHRIIACE
jgi:hypothetical protein